MLPTDGVVPSYTLSWLGLSGGYSAGLGARRTPLIRDPSPPQNRASAESASCINDSGHPGRVFKDDILWLYVCHFERSNHKYCCKWTISVSRIMICRSVVIQTREGYAAASLIHPLFRTNPTIELLDQVTLLILRKVENFPIRPDGEMVSRQISASCCSKNRHHISEDCGFESHFGRVFFCSFACSTRFFLAAQLSERYVTPLGTLLGSTKLQ